MKVSDASEFLAEFFEVALHCIIFSRNVYPAAAFERKQKYNIPVQICCHPEVKSYIDNVAEQIKKLLKCNEVEKVVISLLDEIKTPVEQFIFDVNLQKNANDVLELNQLEIDRAFRAFCLKINVSSGDLQGHPQVTSFAVHIHVPEEGTEKLLDTTCADEKDTHYKKNAPEYWLLHVTYPVGNVGSSSQHPGKQGFEEDVPYRLGNTNFHWIEAENQENKINNGRMVILKSANTSLFRMQLYAVEEGQ